MGLGSVEGMRMTPSSTAPPHFFTDLDVATGEVITQFRPRHRHLEFLVFLRQIETPVPNYPSTLQPVSSCDLGP